MAKPPIRHILVLVDGTEASYNAADAAIDLARSLGSKLTAMAVVDTDTLRQLLSVKILVDAEMGEFEKEASGNWPRTDSAPSTAKSWLTKSCRPAPPKPS